MSTDQTANHNGISARIMGIEKRLDGMDQSLSDQKQEYRASQHEQMTMMLDLRKLVIELNARWVAPGQSPWCLQHSSKVENLVKEMEMVKKKVWVASGMVAVIVVVLNLASPIIKHFINGNSTAHIAVPVPTIRNP